MFRVVLTYVDPSVMTYTVQALAAVAVAFSAIAGVAFRRTRKALFNIFNIDENAGRVVEAPASRIEDSKQVDAARLYAQNLQESLQGKFNDAGSSAHVTPKQRFWQSVLVAAAFMFTVFFMAPIEIVNGGAGDLVLTPHDALVPALVLCVSGTVVLSFVFMLMKGQAYTFALMLLAGLTFASYVQAAFLNTGLPLANGDPVPWDDYTKKTLVTGVIWLAVVLLPSIVVHFFRNKARSAIMAGLAVLVLIQAVGAVSILLRPTQDTDNKEQSIITADGLYSLAPKNNVVIFVLDTYDIRFFNEVKEKYPEILDEYTGFTWYTDASGAMVPTALGLPFLLTQVYPQSNETYHDFADHRYENGSFLKAIGESGYDFGLYSTTLEIRHYDEATKRDLIYQYTSNIHPIDHSFVDLIGSAGVLAQTALYRDLPWALKRFAWYYTEDINNRSMAAQASHPYLFDDYGYYQQLLTEGLSIDTQLDAPGAIKLIHLLGSHVPWNLDANVNYVGNWNSDVIAQSAAATRIVAEYLRQMKALGVYDDATIIVTADHGTFEYTDSPLTEPQNPILLVKQAGAKGDMVESDVPAATEDIHPTVIKAIGGNYTAFGTPVDELTYSDRVRIFYQVLGREDRTFFGIQEYTITGDSNDISNWHQGDVRLEF